MTTNENLAQWKRLVTQLAPGAHPVRAWSLSGGISAGMTALEGVMPGGERRRWVLRRPSAAALALNPHAAGQEFRLLTQLYVQRLPVPQPLLLDESGELLAGPGLVLEYIDGAPEFSPADRVGFARHLAGLLARFHTVQGDFSFLPALPTDVDTLCGPRPARCNVELQEERIRAALAAAGAPPPAPAAGLLHGDFWPGNVLWRGGAPVAVIDWEDAFTGNLLFDLAGARMELAWIMGLDVMDAFTSAYCALTGLEIAALPYWELRAALRLIRWAGSDLAGWAAFFAPYGRPDITAESIRAQYGAFIGQALVALEAQTARCR